MDGMTKIWWTAHAMQQYGGGFVSALGAALQRADPANTEKIRATWPDYWMQYEAMGELLAREDAAGGL